MRYTQAEAIKEFGLQILETLEASIATNFEFTGGYNYENRTTELAGNKIEDDNLDLDVQAFVEFDSNFFDKTSEKYVEDLEDLDFDNANYTFEINEY